MSIWFTEMDAEMIRYSYKIDDVLYRKKSSFQMVEVVNTKAFGRMLVLDGCIMLTEQDEFVYHEMISHVPANLHGNPETVLIIGGGDGGTVRELNRYKSIKHIDLCEIDEDVVQVSKQFFPEVASGLVDPRVTTRIGDGIEFIKNARNQYDLIIVDSTDPIGPGVGLFTEEFYGHVKQALRKGGVMAAQTESVWFAGEILKKIYNNISHNFSYAYPYVGAVPTYPRGFWSWTVASEQPLDFSGCNLDKLAEIEKDLQYIDKDFFRGLGHLPRFYRKKLGL